MSSACICPKCFGRIGYIGVGQCYCAPAEIWPKNTGVLMSFLRNSLPNPESSYLIETIAAPLIRRLGEIAEKGVWPELTKCVNTKTLSQLSDDVAVLSGQKQFTTKTLSNSVCQIDEKRLPNPGVPPLGTKLMDRFFDEMGCDGWNKLTTELEHNLYASVAYMLYERTHRSNTACLDLFYNCLLYAIGFCLKGDRYRADRAERCARIAWLFTQGIAPIDATSQGRRELLVLTA